MADNNIVQQALDRGYSIDEIADKLSAAQGMDPAEIRDRGYESADILGKLGYQVPDQQGPLSKAVDAVSNLWDSATSNNEKFQHDVENSVKKPVDYTPSARELEASSRTADGSAHRGVIPEADIASQVRGDMSLPGYQNRVNIKPSVAPNIQGQVDQQYQQDASAKRESNLTSDMPDATPANIAEGLGATGSLSLYKTGFNLLKNYADATGNQDLLDRARTAYDTVDEIERSYQPNIRNEAGKMAYEGAAGVLGAAPLLAASFIDPLVGVAGFTAQTGSDSFARYRDAGLSAGASAKAATEQAAVMAATSVIPLGFVARNITKMGVGEFTAKLAAMDVPTFEAQSIAASAIDKAAQNPDRSWSDWWEKDVPGIAKQAVVSAVMFSAVGSAAHGLINRGESPSPVPSDFKAPEDAPSISAADITDHSQRVLNSLNAKINGTTEQTVTLPDGTVRTVPGQLAEAVSHGTIAHRDFLAANMDNPEALANYHGFRLADEPVKTPDQIASNLVAKIADPSVFADQIIEEAKQSIVPDASNQIDQMQADRTRLVDNILNERKQQVQSTPEVKDESLLKQQEHVNNVIQENHENGFSQREQAALDQTNKALVAAGGKPFATIEEANDARADQGLPPLGDIPSPGRVALRESPMVRDDGNPENAGREAASLIASAFGKKVRFVESTDGTDLSRHLHAWYDGSDPNTIWMTGAGKYKPTHLVAHEILHALKNDHPELYKQLADNLRPLIDKAGRDAHLDKLGYNNDPEHVKEEEGIAEVWGDIVGDKNGLLQIAERLDEPHAKQLFRTARDFVSRAIGKLVGKQNLVAKRYVKDLVTAREHIIDAAAEYAKRVHAGEQSVIDSADSTTRMRRGEKDEEGHDLNKLTPEQRSYQLQIEREQRAMTKGAKLSPAERTALPTKKLRDSAMAIRHANPVSKGWAPVDFIGHEEGAPKVKEIPYSFNVPPGMDKAPTKNDIWEKTVGNRIVKEIMSLVERAKSGDKNAQEIIAHKDWYRAMATRLRQEFGAFGDMFADLLGATSPNTQVPQNWANSIDVLRLFVRGDFDDKLQALQDHMDAGGTVDNFKKEMPEQLITKLTGKKYGMNSDKAMKAVLGMWREIKAGDAPKARNFALNLIGQSDMATIDVWAARFLQRLAGKLRIPVAAEGAVKGKWNANVTGVAGAYGFGARAMEFAADKLRKQGVDITAPDLQAVVWFLEKELWGKNAWTNKAGEGWSFEQELDKTPLDRLISGSSIATSDHVPTDSEMADAIKPVSDILKEDKDVLAYRVLPTQGMYAGFGERSFDTELLTEKGWNPSKWISKVVNMASKTNPQQYDTFFSRVLGEKEESPNARPGIEVYFKTEQAIKDAMPIMERIVNHGLDGFTLMVDPRQRRTTAPGADPSGYIGIRMQYVPEFKIREVHEGWADEDEEYRALVSGDSEQVSKVLEAKKDAIADAVDDLMENHEVAYASGVSYDTHVIDKESYHDYSETGSGKTDSPFAGEKSQQPISERLRESAKRIRRIAGSDSTESVPKRESEQAGSVKNRRADDEDGFLEPVPRKFGQEIVDAFQRIAEYDDSFRYPKVNRPTFKSTLEHIVKGGSSLFKIGEPKPNGKGFMVTEIRNTKTGNPAFMIENNRGEFWLNLAQLKSSVDSGSAIYAAAQDFAHYNGKKFIGDPAGLSDTALLRRTENMLSGALRHGTTDFMEPHHKQVSPRDFYGTYDFGPFAAAAQPLRWTPGDTHANIANMALTSYHNIRKLFPEIENAIWNPDTQAFEWLDGRPFDADAIVRHSIIRAIRENGFGDLVGRARLPDGGYRESSPIGSGTLLRGVLTQSLLRAESQESRDKILARLSEGLQRSGYDPVKRPFNNILYRRGENDDEPSPFYSQLQRSLESQPDRIFNQPAKQLSAWLQSNAPKLGIKKDEIQWTGVTDWLNAVGGKVSKEDVMNFIKQNGVQVKDVSLRDHRYDMHDIINGGTVHMEGDDYTVESRGDTYVLLDSNGDRRKVEYSAQDMLDYINGMQDEKTKYSGYTLPGGKNYTELLLTLPSKTEFNSSHWDEPNILAHIRYNERTDAEGKKVLFLEEVQSDWGQQGKKAGFQQRYNPADVVFDPEESAGEDKWYFRVPGNMLMIPKSKYSTPEAAKDYILREKFTSGAQTPAAPFVTDTKSWTGLALKRMISYAAQHGFDKVAWTTGEQNADRYSLAKQVEAIDYAKQYDGNGYILQIETKGDRDGNTHYGIAEDKLEDYVGKDVAQKIINNEGREVGAPEGSGRLNNVDLKVGGEGMKAFYDGIVPQVANDILKKLGTDSRVKRMNQYEPKQYTADDLEVKIIKTAMGEDRKAVFDKASDKQVIDNIFVPSSLERGGVTDDKLKEMVAEEANKQEKEKANKRADGPLGSNMSFDITPEMREKVRSEGLPMFRRADGDDQTETPEFKKWAAGAEVVPRSRDLYASSFTTGNPVVVEALHGTAGDFSSFDFTKAGDVMGGESGVMWFTTGEGRAWGAADDAAGMNADESGANVMPVYVRMKNPLVINNIFSFIGKKSVTGKDIEEALSKAKSDGFDGVIMDGEADGVDLAAFSPEQIKSAVGNNGQFDESNPDIRYRRSGPYNGPGAKLLDSTKDVIRSLLDDALLKVAPMSVGTASDEARRIAKEYANADRLARWQWSLIDSKLHHDFTPEEREQMWNAADEQNELLSLGKSTKGKGLDLLNAKQRAMMDQMHIYGEGLLQRARDVGLFKGEGVPYWTPRIAIMLDDQGEYSRPPSSNVEGGVGGVTTSASSLKQRKYLTSAETEAAMQAKFGEDALIARDIRTIPMAMARLERAIAGRDLVNQIKQLGNKLGTATVSTSEEPGFFTIDSPAFKTFRPRMIEINGKLTPALDQNGNMMFDKTPIYVSKEFEGPLKAVMSQKQGKFYGALMQLKAKSMGLIMYSPLIHNAVEWGRALPMMPGKVITFQVYFDGNRFKHDPDQMRQAILDGMVPIGHRGGTQDITGIMEEPHIQPGRSLTAKSIGGAVGLAHKSSGEAVKRAIDAAGNFWHNTLLWDRVGDLQAGIYANMKPYLMRKGLSEADAGRMAAHWANRFAGALPNESMSATARKVANLMLFSRSFTVGNLGVMKDMFTGMPKDVQAQIRMGSGELALKAAKSAGRRKAIAAFVLDIGLMYAMNSMLQDWLDHEKRGKSMSAIERGYLDRFSASMSELADKPFSRSPFAVIGDIMSNSENEPGKERRIHWGTDDNGTEQYIRMPVGKIGEEFEGWMTSPLETFKKKLSQFSRPLEQTFTNDKGFGQRVYNPDAEGLSGMAETAGRVVANIMKAQIPFDQAQSAVDWYNGAANDADKAKILSPLAGITFSNGAPGGPAVGEMYDASRKHQSAVADIMPAAKRALKLGDEDLARSLMESAHMTPKEIGKVITHQEVPESRLNKRALKEFYKHADDEQKARMDKALESR